MSDIRPTVGDSSWFTEARFGLFIHWGLYSLPARHEWVMSKECIAPDEYRNRYFPKFDPDLYDPRQWADAAADAGMKYFAVTTKHHEGFCLWDTALTDFKAPTSPARRDLLRPMVDAFRERGLRVGLYHSLIDWSHPQFTIDRFHPLRKDPNWRDLNSKRDQQKYADYLHGQVRELLAGQYGKVDMLWLDFSYPTKDNEPDNIEKLGKGHDDWRSRELLDLIRKLQPGIMVNDRLDLLDSPTAWDFKTPEQWQPPCWFRWKGQKVVWEVCHTFSGSWGYHRDEQTWKTPEQLVQLLVDSVSKGGNLILNVGPTPRGEFDERAMDRLRGIGRWMRRHDRAITGCGEAPAEWPAPTDCRYTYNPKTRRLYLHLFNWPLEHVYCHGLGGKVAYAQLLHDGSEIATRDAKSISILSGFANGEGPSDILDIKLPSIRPDVAVPVVELFLKD